MKTEYVTLASLVFIITLVTARRFTPCLTKDNCPMNASCVNKTICICDDLYIAVRMNKTYFECFREAKGYEDRCEYDVQCMKPLGSLATCIHKAPIGHGTCTCKYGSHYKDGVCWQTSRIKERCSNSNNCLIRNPNLKAYCSERHCICPPGYYGVDNGTDCAMKSRLNGECNTDEACREMHAVCRGICLCKNEYVLNREQDRCLYAAKQVGDECIEQAQCSHYLNNSECDDIKGKCVCIPKISHEFGGQCYKSVAINKPCEERAECLVSLKNAENVNCIGGLCACDDGFVLKGSQCVLIKSEPDRGSRTSSLLWIAILFYVFF